MSIAVGQEIGKYRVLKKLGEGGFGAVFQAEHVLMKRLCAIKTLHKNLSGDDKVASRFKREGQVAARFKHPNAIEVYDFDQLPDGTFYIAMEFLSGETLRDRLGRETALDLKTSLEITLQVLAALNAAHRGGVVHRDLKPENVFLERREEHPNFVKVLDFGIAKLKEVAQGGHAVEQQGATVATQEGDFFGTPKYCSPDQCLGKDVDSRSDLYSVGVMLFEALTGRLPFISNTPQGYMAQHLFQAAPLLRSVKPELPEQLERVIARSLEKEPGARWQTAAEMVHALQQAAAELGVELGVSSTALNVKTPGSGTLRLMGLGRRKAPAWALAAALLAAVGGVTLALLRPWEDATTALGSGGPGPDGGSGGAGPDGSADHGAALRRAEAAELDGRIQRLVDEGDFRGALKLLEGKRSTPEAPWIDKMADLLRSRLQGREDDAKSKLRAARRVREKNPADYETAIAELKKVAAAHKSTAAGEEAAAEADRLAKEWEAEADKAFAEAKAAADELAGREEFEKALERLNAFPATFAKTPAGARAAAARDDLARRAAASPAAERKAKADLAEAEAALARSPAALGAAIARFEAVARKHRATRSGEDAARRVEELKRKREEAADAEWQARRGRKDELLAGGKIDEALELCETLPGEFAGTRAREAADQAVEEVRGRAQTLETEARAKADELRAGGEVEAAVALLEPFAALRSPKLAAAKADAEAALASLARIAPLHADMVLIPAGTYTIGSDRKDNERPPHPVALAAFKIDRHEVTNAQFADFIEDAGALLVPPVAPRRYWPGPRPSPEQGRLPVVEVTYAEADAFCRWAGKRLPTEEEWEAAARGEKGALYPWGENVWDPRKEPWRALIKPTLPDPRKPGPGPVDAPEVKDATPLGVVGLAGNVSEWTSSIFKIYDGHPKPPGLDKEPGQGSHGVYRGGSFFLGAQVPATHRFATKREAATDFVGFRAAKDAK